MKIGRQIFALGGLVLLGGSLLPTAESHAFGQQWRPDPVAIGMQGPSPQRTVGMPAFRPQPGPSTRRYEVPDRLSYRPMHPYARPYAYAASVPYGLPQVSHPGYGYAPPLHRFAGYAPMAAPPPAYLPGNMRPSWQPAPPLFARQFAWRPAEQPWVVPVSQGRQAYYPAPVAPQYTGFRPSGPFYGTTAGTWRPSLRASSYPAYPVPGLAPVYAVQQRPAFVPNASAWRSAGVPVARANPAPAGPGPGYWRPVAVAGGGDWRARPGFRPVAYGRSPQREERLASRTDGGFGFTRDKLPGWVTTYEDTADPSSCGWCDGS